MSDLKPMQSISGCWCDAEWAVATISWQHRLKTITAEQSESVKGGNSAMLLQRIENKFIKYRFFTATRLLLLWLLLYYSSMSRFVFILHLLFNIRTNNMFWTYKRIHKIPYLIIVDIGIYSLKNNKYSLLEFSEKKNAILAFSLWYMWSTTVWWEKMHFWI